MGGLHITNISSQSVRQFRNSVRDFNRNGIFKDLSGFSSKTKGFLPKADEISVELYAPRAW